MKERWLEILLNILFWGATSWFIISGFSIESQEMEIINGHETIHTVRNETLIIKLILCISISLIIFYSNLWLINKRAFSGNTATTVAWSLFIFITGAGLFFLSEVLNVTGLQIMLPMPLAGGIFCFYYAVSSTYGFGKVWARSEKRRQQLLLDKKQAELTMLRNQLQPHFLFNALNNLLSMVDQKDSPMLARALGELSQLLRYVVDEAQADKVPIHKEISFLKNYAALQLLRYDPGEVVFDLNIEGEFDKQPVEPGIYLPFVENAFKYGTSPEEKSTIAVHFDLTKSNKIGFKIKNRIFSLHPDQARDGKGIDWTKERLRLVYPEKHQLQISRNGFFTVELNLTNS